MLSIAKLGPGSEGYYLREVAGPQAYYLGAGEAPGVWLGSGSGELGLFGEVSGEQLSAVLASTSPIDGSPLSRRRVAPERHVPGFDLTFSAPKSVSLLYGMAPPEVSEAVRISHDEAVADAIAHLEAHAGLHEARRQRHLSHRHLGPCRRRVPPADLSQRRPAASHPRPCGQSRPRS